VDRDDADTGGQTLRQKASKISAASNRVSADPPTSSPDVTPPMPRWPPRASHRRENASPHPTDRMWRDFFRGKIPRHVANRNLVPLRAN